jgi:hypothetical protein
MQKHRDSTYVRSSSCYLLFYSFLYYRSFYLMLFHICIYNLTAFLYRLFFYIDYYTQNHEIQGNTVNHELLYFLVFRDFECNNRYKKIIDTKKRWAMSPSSHSNTVVVYRDWITCKNHTMSYSPIAEKCFLLLQIGSKCKYVMEGDTSSCYFLWVS